MFFVVLLWPRCMPSVVVSVTIHWLFISNSEQAICLGNCVVCVYRMPVYVDFLTLSPNGAFPSIPLPVQAANGSHYSIILLFYIFTDFIIIIFLTGPLHGFRCHHSSFGNMQSFFANSYYISLDGECRHIHTPPPPRHSMWAGEMWNVTNQTYHHFKHFHLYVLLNDDYEK